MSATHGDRIPAIDILRGIAIAAVVMRHVSWSYLTPASLLMPDGHAVAAAYIASDLGVPLFVALSAFGLSWRHAQPFRGGGAVFGFLRSRAMRLLPAYALWSIVSLAARDHSLHLSPRSVGEALLFGTADVQFYFVPMVFELYLLWPLLRPVMVRRTIPGAALLLMAGAAAADLAWRGVVTSPWTPLVFLATAVATGAVLPLLVGAGVRRDGEPFARPATAATFAAALALAVVAGFAFESCVSTFLAACAGNPSRGAIFLAAMIPARAQALFATALTLSLALVAAPLARMQIGALLAALGRSSFGVFLVHLLVASTFVKRWFGGADVLVAGGGAMVPRMLGVWVATLIVSFALVRVVERVPHLRWTMGNR